MLKVTDERLIVCCSVYTALELAATTIQRCLSLPMTYGNSKLNYAVYRSAPLISAPGISIYNGLLLMITAHW